MPDCPETVLATPDRLEHTFESWEVKNGGKIDGDILNTFLGTDELRSMGQHLVVHMRDEERWGESNGNFEPVDFVVAAYEVAQEHTLGSPRPAGSFTGEQQPPKMTFNIFIDFWLPRIAKVAYGEEYGNNVRSIVKSTKA